jgi:hypothetical protein
MTLVRTDFRVGVLDTIAQVTVSQCFQFDPEVMGTMAPEEYSVEEGRYFFPLSNKASVSRFVATVGTQAPLIGVAMESAQVLMQMSCSFSHY